MGVITEKKKRQLCTDRLYLVVWKQNFFCNLILSLNSVLCKLRFNLLSEILFLTRKRAVDSRRKNYKAEKTTGYIFTTSNFVTFW